MRQTLANIFKSRNEYEFIRICILIFLVTYIVFQVLDSADMFIEKIDCGAETLIEQGGKQYFEAGSYRFDNALGRSDEKAFEGKYSVKRTSEEPYGFSITMGTPEGKDELEASVWCFENKNIAHVTEGPTLIASSGEKFWKGTAEAVENKDGWSKLDLKISIPDGHYDAPLVIYCWNNTKNVVYFDNMMIKRRNFLKLFKNH